MRVRREGGAAKSNLSVHTKKSTHTHTYEWIIFLIKINLPRVLFGVLLRILELKQEHRHEASYIATTLPIPSDFFIMKEINPPPPCPHGSKMYFVLYCLHDLRMQHHIQYNFGYY